MDFGSAEKVLKLKILVIGETGAGKTSFVTRYVDDRFDFVQSKSIVKTPEFRIKRIVIGTKKVELQIWDTGQTLNSNHYKHVDGALFVYDVSSRRSFGSLRWHLTDFETIATDKNIVKMLVGNKIDKDKRVITYEQGKMYTEGHDMLFSEVSAKTNEGVYEAFSELAQKAVTTADLRESSRRARSFPVENAPRK